MIRLITAAVIICFFPARCPARDFIVEYVEENYQETQLPASYHPVIYHSLQVRSDVGPKLLILKGADYHYRKWIRSYIAENKQLIAKIPDMMDDSFIASRAFELDITDLHPVNLAEFRKAQQRMQDENDGKLPSYLFIPSGPRKADKTKLKTDEKSKPEAVEQTNQAEKLKQEEALKLESEKEKEQALKEEAQQQKIKKAEEALKAEKEAELLKALEQQQREHEKFLAALAQQRERDEKDRREELNQRWQELKARLQEDDRLRNMSLDERNSEIQRRWSELRQRFGFQ